MPGTPYLILLLLRLRPALGRSQGASEEALDSIQKRRFPPGLSRSFALPPVPTLGHVVTDPRNHNSRQSRHAITLPDPSLCVNKPLGV